MRQILTEKFKTALTAPANNVARFQVPLNGGGTLTRVDAYAANVTGSGYWYINVRVNGVAQFAGESRLKINVDNKHAVLTGLSIAVADNDVISFDVQVAGSATLFPFLQCAATIEDGDGGGSGTLAGLTDVDVSGVMDGDALRFDNGSGLWIPASLAHTHALDSLSDVNAPAPSDGDVLTFDTGSGDWINAAPSGGTNALDDLTDVVISSPAIDEVIKYNGSEFVNAPAPSSGWTTIIKPADESKTSNTTYSDDADFQFATAANSIYHVRGEFFFVTAAGTVNCKFRWNNSQTPVEQLFGVEWIGTFVTVPTGLNFSSNALSTANPSADNVIAASGFFSVVRFDGYFLSHATNTGLFSIQWAQNSSVGSALIMRKGGALEYRKA